MKNASSTNANAGSLWAAGGMAALLLGRKTLALGLFARGIEKLERNWRAAHPEFKGGLGERWDAATAFYEQTHKNPVNRWLHITGIPMIALGAAGLLSFKPFRPAWSAAAGAFTTGWALNLVGHAIFEKNAPAFKDDPLSFLAGPIWDIKQAVQGWQGVTTQRPPEPPEPEPEVAAASRDDASAWKSASNMDAVVN
jgi:hypothetical protein